MKLYDLKTNHETELLGTDVKPYFSWKLESEEEGTLQKSYRLVVKNQDEVIWDTGLRETDQSIFVPYTGIPLKSRTRYTWRVTVSDNHGNMRNLKSVIKHFKGEISGIIHCGDVEYPVDRIEALAECPTYGAKGNCDYYWR